MAQSTEPRCMRMEIPHHLNRLVYGRTPASRNSFLGMTGVAPCPKTASAVPPRVILPIDGDAAESPGPVYHRCAQGPSVYCLVRRRPGRRARVFGVGRRGLGPAHLVICEQNFTIWFASGATMMQMSCRLIAWLLAMAVLWAGSDAVADEALSPQTALQDALPLFLGPYAQAIPLLKTASQDAELRNEVVLLLISPTAHRGLGKAEPLLREAATSGDAETKEAATLFLGLLYDEQGATDQAEQQGLLARVFGRQRRRFGSSADRIGCCCR